MIRHSSIDNSALHPLRSAPAPFPIWILFIDPRDHGNKQSLIPSYVSVQLTDLRHHAIDDPRDVIDIFHTVNQLHRSFDLIWRQREAGTGAIFVSELLI